MIILKIFLFIILLVIGIIVYRVGKVLWFVKKMRDTMLSKKHQQQNPTNSNQNSNKDSNFNSEKILETQECNKCGQFMSQKEMKSHYCQ